MVGNAHPTKLAPSFSRAYRIYYIDSAIKYAVTAGLTRSLLARRLRVKPAMTDI